MRHITFATKNMTISGMKCVASAERFGLDSVCYREDDIPDFFYLMNQDIFKHDRGYGYWLWKPFIVYLEMLDMQDGEKLIYTDAGIEFVNDPLLLGDVSLFGNNYNHEHWCKGVVMDRIQHDRGDRRQVQASAMIFTVSDKTKAFIKEWLMWCQIPEMIIDGTSPTDHPEYREHRHDQAILTCLAYREDIPLHWWPAMYNNGAFTYDKGMYHDEYPVIFHHHRKRNDEW